MDHARLAALREAVNLVGFDQLAAALNVERERLDTWMNRGVSIPDREFFALAIFLDRVKD